jgi:hypothetical protein
MNIDNENNILIIEDEKASVISLNDFKDMVLGTLKGDKPIYFILTE